MKKKLLEIIPDSLKDAQRKKVELDKIERQIDFFIGNENLPDLKDCIIWSERNLYYPPAIEIKVEFKYAKCYLVDSNSLMTHGKLAIEVARERLIRQLRNELLRIVRNG